MAASIRRMVPVTRNQGVQVPGLLPIAQWIDALVLVANAAQSYTLPTDTTQTPNVKGTILRLTANAGPLYINFAGTAAVPGAITNGSSSVMLRTDLGSVMLVVPHSTDTLSIISPNAAVVTIEAWS
jgi:hypothetical protein